MPCCRNFSDGGERRGSFAPLRNQFVAILLVLLYACSCENSTDPKPVPANCRNGQSPCEHDVTQCCIDTTSHNFFWGLDTLGGPGSWVRDVSIVDQDNIWACGLFTSDLADFNVANWNGYSWIFYRVHTPTYYGNLAFGESTCILADSPNDIWIMSYYGGYARYNGDEWLGGYDSRISSCINDIMSVGDSVYFCGSNSSVGFYDGVDFVSININSNYRMIHLSGSEDAEHIFALGQNNDGESIVYHYSQGAWDVIIHSEDPSPTNQGEYGMIQSISAVSDTVYVSTYNGLLRYHYLHGTSQYTSHNETVNPFFSPINSNSWNDLFILRNDFTIYHFNGDNWQSDNNVSDIVESGSGFAHSGSANGSIVVLGGILFDQQYGIIARGYR